MKLKKLTALLSTALILIASLCSCATPPATTPEEGVEQFLNYFAAHKYNNAFNYVEGYDGFSFDDRNSSATKKIVRAVSDSMTYTVTGKTESDNPIEVMAKITTVDLREIYKTCAESVVKEMFNGVLSGNEINSDKFKSALNSAVIEAAKAEGAPTCTTDVKFKLNQANDSWLIVMDDFTFDQVCGYINSANDWLYNRMITEGAVKDGEAEGEQTESTVASEGEVASTAENTDTQDAQ